MAYHVEWYEEPHIVFVRLSGKLTQEDLAGFAAGLVGLASTVPDKKVHALVDVTEVISAPPITIVVQEIRQMLDAFPNRDMSVMYGANKVVRFLAEMLYKFTALRIKLLDTREEAIDFITSMLETQQGDAPDA